MAQPLKKSQALLASALSLTPLPSDCRLEGKHFAQLCASGACQWVLPNQRRSVESDTPHEIDESRIAAYRIEVWMGLHVLQDI